MKRERSFALELLIQRAWQFRGFKQKSTYPGDYMRGYVTGQYKCAREAIILCKMFGNSISLRSMERRRNERSS